jgi:hypothetical protein
MRIWEPQAGAHKNIFFKKSSLWLSPNLSSKSSSVWLALFLYHVDHPNKHHQQIRLTKQISKSPLVLIRLFWIFTGIYQRPNSRATVMRADTASITTPAKPERNFAVTTAIVPVTTAIAQSKKMKIRLGIEKTSKKTTKNRNKKK